MFGQSFHLVAKVYSQRLMLDNAICTNALYIFSNTYSADSKFCKIRPVIIKIKVKECCHKNNLFAKPSLLAAF